MNQKYIISLKEEILQTKQLLCCNKWKILNILNLKKNKSLKVKVLFCYALLNFDG